MLFLLKYLRGGCALALVALTLPALTEAATFPTSLAIIKSVGLKVGVQVDGQGVKSPAVVGANTDFTIIWSTAPNTALGCVGNFAEGPLPPSGSAVGSITASRSFVITCYGRGAAQTATLQVNVGVADLVVSSFSATGLKSAKGQRGSYLAGPYTLKASIRNAGKLKIGVPFRVKYLESADGQGNWISISEKTILAMPGAVTITLDPLLRQGNAGVGARYYQVCLDTENKVSEAKEDNNCSRVLGPYSFVAVP